MSRHESSSAFKIIVESLVVNEGSVENFKIFHFAKRFAPLCYKIKSKLLIYNSVPVDVWLLRGLRWWWWGTLNTSMRGLFRKEKDAKVDSMNTTTVPKGI